MCRLFIKNYCTISENFNKNIPHTYFLNDFNTPDK